ncbi:MAG: sugar ABC transporter permease [Clostridia bacterium]|nr:sugar ABC transporter permease [Clostridia bacterium]
MSEKVISMAKKPMTRQQKRLVFYLLMFALPILQFLLFYIYVNFNSIIVAFQERTYLGGEFHVAFTTKNVKEAFSFFFSASGLGMLWRSVQLLLGQLIIVTPLALLFSYYIAKEKRGASFFRLALYLPQVVSVVVLGTLFEYLVDRALPAVFSTKPLLLTNGTVTFYASLIFTLWFSFGTNVLIFTGAMSGVDQSVVESAQLDGVTSFQEFLYIYVPMIFSTVTTFVLTGLAGIFNNQMNLHIFFGVNAEFGASVYGYYFYQIAARDTTGDLLSDGSGNFMSLRALAALGLISTCILVPMTLGVRKLLNKYGPSAE